jgi:hypothetical protein
LRSLKLRSPEETDINAASTILARKKRPALAAHTRRASGEIGKW